MKHGFVIASLLAMGLSACKPTTPIEGKDPAADQPATKAEATSAASADDNLNAVIWVQSSVEYEAVSVQTYHAAAQLLDRALEQKNWNALVSEEQSASNAELPAAIILDVDETVLDNSPYQARLIQSGTEYNEVSWDAWVSEKKARALPGVVDFAKAAETRGITLLYLSNRAAHLKDATLSNLKEVGMPVKDDSVFLGLGKFVKDCEQNGSEKTCRRQLAGRQYRVIMQFGDQLGDFVEILANVPEGRAKLMGEYRNWFGERWWMLPNPTYGSWEPALFNNDFSKPREVRRATKRASLREDKVQR